MFSSTGANVNCNGAFVNAIAVPPATLIGGWLFCIDTSKRNAGGGKSRNDGEGEGAGGMMTSSFPFLITSS